MPRQFPRLKLQHDGHRFLLSGNAAALGELEWLIREVLKGNPELVDEAGQARWGCKHGEDKIEICVRNLDVFEQLPVCGRCGGEGVLWVDYEGNLSRYKNSERDMATKCGACNGFGREMPEDAKRELPFFT